MLRIPSDRWVQIYLKLVSDPEVWPFDDIKIHEEKNQIYVDVYFNDPEDEIFFKLKWL